MTNETTVGVPTHAQSCQARMQQEIIDRLEGSGHFELRRVCVMVDDDRVLLSGTVPTYYKKQIAQETARKVCPDRQVLNELLVTGSPG